LIASCLDGSKTSGYAVIVLSARPQTDEEFFGRQAKRLGWPDPSVLDVRNIVSRSPDPSRGIVSVFRKELRKRAGEQTLLVGDWTYLAYDRFEVVLATEEGVTRLTDPLCCYRGEGFWSLGIKHIARILEMHSQVRFASTVFGKESDSAA
jgi:hypothetical protein